MGDPAGIGPEIICKATRKLVHINTVIIGSPWIFEKTCKQMGEKFRINVISSFNEYQAGTALLDAVTPAKFKFGSPDEKSARMALQSLDQGIALIKRRLIDGLVTSPIWKEGIRTFHRKFIGHTEYLAEIFKIKDYAMMGISGEKRILFLTTHIPLCTIFKCITVKNIVARLRLLKSGLEDIFLIKRPRIGVPNLNPHGQEFSAGEDEIIARAIKQAQNEGIRAFGPFPADTLFKQKFDGFLAIYHDQGMIFLKSRPYGVNFTLGLPFIRTSPLHGTAFDIAGQNQASPASMIAAIKLTTRLARRIKGLN